MRHNLNIAARWAAQAAGYIVTDWNVESASRQQADKLICSSFSIYLEHLASDFWEKTSERPDLVCTSVLAESDRQKRLLTAHFVQSLEALSSYLQTKIRLGLCGHTVYDISKIESVCFMCLVYFTLSSFRGQTWSLRCEKSHMPKVCLVPKKLNKHQKHIQLIKCSSLSVRPLL